MGVPPQSARQEMPQATTTFIARGVFFCFTRRPPRVVLRLPLAFGHRELVLCFGCRLEVARGRGSHGHSDRAFSLLSWWRLSRGRGHSAQLMRLRYCGFCKSGKRGHGLLTLHFYSRKFSEEVEVEKRKKRKRLLSTRSMED